jgi:hypothetical protein
MSDQHELSAFSEVLNSTERPILVGGQAVNLWAEHYSSVIPQLEPLRPFMSKDADIFGDRAMAERIAANTKWQLKCYNEPRSIAVGLLTKQVPGGEPLLIEVIGGVNGLTAKDLSDPDLLEIRPGQIYRVPSPIILLKGKLANVAHLDQTRRQDVRHVKMLIPCAREYIRENHIRALSGQMTERHLVNLLESANDLRTNPAYAELGRQNGFELIRLFPIELAESKLEKISRFVKFRAPEIALQIETSELVDPEIGKTNPSKGEQIENIPKKASPSWSLEDFTPRHQVRSKDRELEL